VRRRSGALNGHRRAGARTEGWRGGGGSVNLGAPDVLGVRARCRSGARPFDVIMEPRMFETEDFADVDPTGEIREQEHRLREQVESQPR
jgi:hypothetical protein